MIVLEKTNAVGVLKSLGSKRKQIVSIFLIQGAILGLSGILLGCILGYCLMYLQIQFNVITLPSSVYFMSKVPFLITFDTFILIAILTFLLCLVVSFIPSYIASTIKPVNALRFS
jgi:lipoprotein-releasing system permease protein